MIKSMNLIDIDFALASKQAGGMYMLVIKTAALQRDLRRRRESSGSADTSKTGVIALHMIQTAQRV